MFGEFNCPCGRKWKSASSWEDSWQECLLCKAKVFPKNLRPLLYTGGDAGQKPHESEHCEKCIRLGYNCRDYSPIVTKVDDDGYDDDAQSVFSEASTASSSSVDDRRWSDEGNTPVASDEDEDNVDELLERRMKLMKLK